MSTSITVHLKDGTKKEFPHEGRGGGSYTKSIRYEGGFAIVKDEYYNETAFPSENIERVDVRTDGY